MIPADDIQDSLQDSPQKSPQHPQPPFTADNPVPVSISPDQLPFHQVHGPEALSAFVEQFSQKLPGANREPAIIDYGQFHHGVGQPPPPFSTRILQTGQVQEHWADDLTIRVDGGTTIQQIREALAEKKQWLALDALHPEMSIAEAITHNCFGALRHHYGSLRDQLLGLAYVNAQGQIITVGGRTVKNVAGYDLTKFMVGSLNEFGLIAQATLRSYAYPELIRLFEIRDAPPTLFDRSTPLVISDGNPDGALYHWTPESSFFSGVFTGVSSGVEAQTQALKNWLPASVDFSSRDVSMTDFISVWDQHWSWRFDAQLPLLKLMVPPVQTGQAFNALSKLEWFQAEFNPHVVAQPFEGQLWLSGAWDALQTMKCFKDVHEITGDFTRQLLKYRVPKDCPLVTVKPHSTSLPILENIKHQLDPNNLFNPGRFVTSLSTRERLRKP